MNKMKPIQYFWGQKNFKPTDEQKEAILHVEGPLFLTAGPGSGKTRVLLWRTLNLIVYHSVAPEEIFLSTFTEKAASQLVEGLRSLLALVSNTTKKHYDTSKMSIGTVHSICQKIVQDRRFIEGMERRPSQSLLDELGQYFFLSNKNNWIELISFLGYQDDEDAHKHIDGYFKKGEQKISGSRHNAIENCIKIFNRFSEECLEPRQIKPKSKEHKDLLGLYQKYLALLEQDGIKTVDFSLLQKSAFETISSFSGSGKVFRHVIVDEYQDTNSIQEKIFFALAKGHKNICVVGDDDQALYRFRGATVENLVEFEDRCKCNLKVIPKTIDLNKNFRSRSKIVDFYKSFIETEDWTRGKGKKGHYRVAEKNITPYSTDTKPSVIVSEPAIAEEVYEEIAEFVKKLKESKKVDDYNQVTMLFPAMKNNARVAGFKKAFDKHEIPVYAPRAGRFMEIPESVDIYGLLLKIFGKPEIGEFSQGLRDYKGWLSRCEDRADELMEQDDYLKAYVENRKQELALILKDYNTLNRVADRKKWDKAGELTDDMIVPLSEAAGLSFNAKKALTNSYFRKSVERRRSLKKPVTLSNAINRATSVDWTVLDLFYQLNGFKHFRKMYDLAHKGKDEGPICNLGLITQYLDRFMDQYSPIITASFIKDGIFTRSFFGSFNYALYRRSESEFEDAQDPFPKGRVSFLTIHQAKGLEFPVVIMGSLYKRERQDHFIEETVRKLTGKGGEPLDKISRFDIMRMFYVALSRPQNLLVLPNYKGQGSSKCESFKTMLEDDSLPKISEFNINSLPRAKNKDEDLGNTYSYTGDYLEYQKCPRSYMIYRKYGFTPSRSQTMFFGSLVHKTIEDLHYFLKSEAQKNG